MNTIYFSDALQHIVYVPITCLLNDALNDASLHLWYIYITLFAASTVSILRCL